MNRGFSFFFLILSYQLSGQSEDKVKVARPDIPGTFVIDFGLNRPLGAPADFDVSFFGSRSLNIYYQYDIKIPFLGSRFVFTPGIGFGLDRYKFKNNYTLEFEAGTGNVAMVENDLDIRKSQLITDYLDAPLELRYINNPSDPNRSLKISVGFRAGLLYRSLTKIKYKDDTETIKDKMYRNWNLNTYRYGIYGKVAFGNFGLFSYYNLTPLFKGDSGPGGSQMNSLSIGISLSGL